MEISKYETENGYVPDSKIREYFEDERADENPDPEAEYFSCETDDPNEAIYMLRDGSLVSGVDNYGERTMDHKEATGLITEGLQQLNSSDKLAGDFWSKLHAKTGMVRLVPETQEALIGQGQKLTSEQQDTLDVMDYDIDEYTTENLRTLQDEHDTPLSNDLSQNIRKQKQAMKAIDFNELQKSDVSAHLVDLTDSNVTRDMSVQDFSNALKIQEQMSPYALYVTTKNDNQLMPFSKESIQKLSNDYFPDNSTLKDAEKLAPSISDNTSYDVEKPLTEKQFAKNKEISPQEEFVNIQIKRAEKDYNNPKSYYYHDDKRLFFHEKALKSIASDLDNKALDYSKNNPFAMKDSLNTAYDLEIDKSVKPDKLDDAIKNTDAKSLAKGEFFAKVTNPKHSTMVLHEHDNEYEPMNLNGRDEVYQYNPSNMKEPVLIGNLQDVVDATKFEKPNIKKQLELGADKGASNKLAQKFLEKYHLYMNPSTEDFKKANIQAGLDSNEYCNINLAAERNLICNSKDLDKKIASQIPEHDITKKSLDDINYDKLPNDTLLSAGVDQGGALITYYKADLEHDTKYMNNYYPNKSQDSIRNFIANSIKKHGDLSAGRNDMFNTIDDSEKFKAERFKSVDEDEPDL